MNLKDFLNPPEDETRIFKSPKYWADLLEHLHGQDDSRVKSISMTPRDYAYIRQFGRDIFDICNQKVLLEKGFRGTMYNVEIWNHRSPTNDHLKVSSEVNGTIEEFDFCCITNQKTSGPCTNPECIVRHIHLC